MEETTTKTSKLKTARDAADTALVVATLAYSVYTLGRLTRDWGQELRERRAEKKAAQNQD